MVQAQALIERLMDSRDDADIMSAARELAPRSGLAPHAARLLEDVLNTGTAPRAAAAAFVLAEWGPTALGTSPGLVNSLRKQTAHHNVTVRHWSVAALMRLGQRASAAVPDLIAALRDPDDGVRTVSAHALSELRESAADAVPALVDAAFDSQKDVRRAAVTALQQIDPTGARATAELVRGLNSPSSRVRMFAAEALGWMNAGAASATDQLIACVHDTQPFVRARAVEALIRIVPGHPVLLKALAISLHDPDEEVRVAAVRGLDTFLQTPVAVAPCLIAALRDRQEQVRFHAIELLERIAHELGSLIPAVNMAIGNCLRDPSPLVQTRAVQASGRLSKWTHRADPKLLNALYEADDAVRLATIQTLARMHSDPAVLDALRFRLADEVATIRVATCVTLFELGEDAAVILPTLLQATGDSSPAVQLEAIRFLGQMGAAALGACETLTSKLADSNPDVRSAAARTIKQIESALEHRN